MITNDLQKRIHDGDREAFKAVYSEYGRDIYLNALKTLGNEADARSVVKQTFLNLHHELLRSSEAIDIPKRLRELADNELLLMEILDSKTLTQSASATASARQAVPQKKESFEERSAPIDVPDDEPFRDAPRRPQRERPAFDDDNVLPDEDRESLPPLERTRSYMHADGENDLRMREQERAVLQSRRGRGFGRFLLILFLLILLWVVAGILMDFGFVPHFDLGYTWFNVNIFPFFTFGS